MTRLADLRAAIGRLWGATTTHLLAFLIMIQPILQGVDPTLLTPTMRYAILGVAIAAVFLRVFCPPPPHVTVETADAMHVDHDAGIITIAKEAPIPSSMVSKAAGESS